MTWLLITVIAYFLLAVASIMDKTLLKKGAIPNPFVYTFYIALVGAGLMILLLPLGISWPGVSQFWMALLAGATTTLGLFLMFFALRHEEASRLTPMIGGLTPVVVILLARFFLGEQLSGQQLAALTLVIMGTFLISLEFNRQQGILFWLRHKIGFKAHGLPKVRRTLFLAMPAAVFFGLSWVLTKDVYNHQPFVSGFFWTRLGALVIALLPIFWPANYRAIFHRQGSVQEASRAKYRFLFGQACGGAGTILVQIAVSLASVSIVQAMQGVQYVFIFLMVVVLGMAAPRFLKEPMSPQIIIQKLIAIALIAAGLFWII